MKKKLCTVDLIKIVWGCISIEGFIRPRESEIALEWDFFDDYYFL